MIQRILHILGVEHHPVSHTERLVAGVGAFVGILAVFLTSTFFISDSGSYLVVASMGASAVLLFAVPHGALSQPWPLFGGHVISAIIGVASFKLIPNELVAAPLAVGLAVSAMHYLRCIHPPGGATALSAVVGGAEIKALAYEFVVTPVLLNVLAILVTAIAFNFVFAWRRYPAYFSRSKNEPASSQKLEANFPIAHEDFVHALSEVDSFIDITEHDLIRIYELATKSRESRHFDPSELKLGSFYSNGKYGNEWGVRRIIDLSAHKDSKKRSLVYRVVVGAGRRTTVVTPSKAFAKWAKYEVRRIEGNWRRVSNE